MKFGLMSHAAGIRATRGLVLFVAMGLAANSLLAVERILEIDAPTTVVAGTPVAATITARTNAGGGEQVGFLQAEVSVDDGKTWKAVCYLANVGAAVVQPASLASGPVGSFVELRVRAAFRDGLAGDVDWRGGALRWHDSWREWRAPAAKSVRVEVVAP